LTAKLACIIHAEDKRQKSKRSEAKTQSQSPERSEGEAWGKKIKVSHLQTIFNICF